MDQGQKHRRVNTVKEVKRRENQYTMAVYLSRKQQRTEYLGFTRDIMIINTALEHVTSFRLYQL